MASKCTGGGFAALLFWLSEKTAFGPLPVGPFGSSLIVGRRHPVVGELLYCVSFVERKHTGTKSARLPNVIARPDLDWSGYATVGMSSGLGVDNRLKKSVRPTKTSLCQKPGKVETN